LAVVCLRLKTNVIHSLEYGQHTLIAVPRST